MTATTSRHATRFVAACALIALLAAPGTALAHVDLEASSPEHGASLDQPVDRIVLDFTAATEPTGPGVQVFDETGAEVPAAVENTSETRIVVTPDTPLEGGTFAVTWTVTAGDEHPRTGGIEFVVTATAAPESATEDGTEPVAQIIVPPEPAGSLLAEVSVTVDTAMSDWLGRIAGALVIVAALLGIGSLAFGAFVFLGPEREARIISFWIRRAGVMLTAGALLGVVADVANPTHEILDVLTGTLGLTHLLRVGGGLALTAGARLPDEGAWQPTSPPAPAGGTAVLTETPVRLGLQRIPVAVVGAGLVASSFVFDGHTAIASPQVLVRLSSLVHVIAASVWVGGVALLARLLIGRHRRGEPVEASRLVIPFSTIAGPVVAFVGLTGSLLALSIANGLSTFFTTPWGWALIAKLLLAATAGAIGAYNHRVVVPMLRWQQDSPQAEAAIRSTVRIESTVLIAIGVVTAVLVGLSSV